MDISRAIAVVNQARNLQEVRLQRGILRRQQMAADIAAGKPLGDAPRARWLHDAASAVLDAVAEEARKFNEANPDDLISAQDVGDAISNALHRLTVYVGGDDV